MLTFSPPGQARLGSSVSVTLDLRPYSGVVRGWVAVFMSPGVVPRSEEGWHILGAMSHPGGQLNWALSPNNFLPGTYYVAFQGFNSAGDPVVNWLPGPKTTQIVGPVPYRVMAADSRSRPGEGGTIEGTGLLLIAAAVAAFFLLRGSAE